ncbi:unnamed protein product, partial [marine sediment metagenome]
MTTPDDLALPALLEALKAGHDCPLCGKATKGSTYRRRAASLSAHVRQKHAEAWEAAKAARRGGVGPRGEGGEGVGVPLAANPEPRAQDSPSLESLEASTEQALGGMAGALEGGPGSSEAQGALRGRLLVELMQGGMSEADALALMGRVVERLRGESVAATAEGMAALDRGDSVTLAELEAEIDSPES